MEVFHSLKPIYICCMQSLDWSVGLECWTGVMDWREWSGLLFECMCSTLPVKKDLLSR